MNKPLFTIIILHYNQEKFLYKALDSVLIQDYENIELIISDDCSIKFNDSKMKEYIEKKRKKNIKNVIISKNEVNFGTVKNINQAIKKSSGEYILFFAADDVLYDDKVVSNFIEGFEELPDDYLVLGAQCVMYDEELKEIKYLFVENQWQQCIKTSSPKQPCIKTSSPEQLFKTIAFRCVFAAGSTCFKRVIFEKYGYFNEQYRMIEDWSYYLYITRSGVKIAFENFLALKHREGGVSHGNKFIISNNNYIRYQDDTILIMENEIMPYLKIFSLGERIRFIDWYENQRRHYHTQYGVSEFPRLKRSTYIFRNLDVYIYRIYKKFYQIINSKKKAIIYTSLFSILLLVLSAICNFEGVLTSITGSQTAVEFSRWIKVIFFTIGTAGIALTLLCAILLIMAGIMKIIKRIIQIKRSIQRA